MTDPALEQVGRVLVLGYPGADSQTSQEFHRVIELVLPALSQRAAGARRQGKKEIQQVWEVIREDSEGLFQGALAEVERLKVIYVASKFMNNKTIGHLITQQALELARKGQGR